jgi:hypothetical protein
MEAIRHRVGITAPQHEVKEKLTTREGLASWWTREVDIDGNVIEFRFATNSVEMEVVEDTESRVVWKCVKGPEEWEDNLIAFDLSRNGEESIVNFTHEWREPVEFMSHCSTKWGYFLVGMKASLEGGEGTPYPGELLISSWG